MKTELIQHPTTVILDGQALTQADVLAVARSSTPVTIGDHAMRRMQAARLVIDTLADEGKKVYGVTTGFGHLSSVRIPHSQLVELQHNLLRSHASGVGEPLTEEIVRAMMLLLAASLARGNSGVRVEIVQMLVAMLNARVSRGKRRSSSIGAPSTGHCGRGRSDLQRAALYRG